MTDRKLIASLQNQIIGYMLPTAENETRIKEEKERKEKTGGRMHLATQATILFVSCTFLL